MRMCCYILMFFMSENKILPIIKVNILDILTLAIFKYIKYILNYNSLAMSNRKNVDRTQAVLYL
jgi:hypothetical protein